MKEYQFWHLFPELSVKELFELKGVFFNDKCNCVQLFKFGSLFIDYFEGVGINISIVEHFSCSWMFEIKDKNLSIIDEALFFHTQSSCTVNALISAFAIRESQLKNIKP